MEEKNKIFIKIYGRVQGIGYRWFVLEKAEKYNLGGWVRNVDDGTVECAVKGREKDIEKFIEEIKNDHPYAYIKKIDTNPYNDDLPDKFIIKH